MLAHTGGAAALDVSTWLVAYGAAAVVVVVTAGLRGRLLVDAARDDVDGDPVGPGGSMHEAHSRRCGRPASPAPARCPSSSPCCPATSNDRPAAGGRWTRPEHGPPE